MLDELIHWCTRCKLDLNHRVIQVDNGVPKRILCLTCQSDRVYRPKSLSNRKAAFGKAAAMKLAQENALREKLQSSKRSPKAYSMDGVYKLDDIISHQTFGLGLATEIVFPDKLQIFFDDGMRLLKCGRIER
ncbi:MAG: hypothetical protein U1F66_10995 [bacterium]